MNILQMKQFKVIAEYENITKAAEILFISASALHKVLHSIEEELGCELFDRIGRNIKLNGHGRKLLYFINNIIDNYEQIYQYFDTFEKPPKTLKCIISATFLNILMFRYYQKYPNAPIAAEILSFKKALELLLNAKADIIFTDNFSLEEANSSLLKEENQNISKFYLLKNDLYLIAPPDSKYKYLSEINLQDLENDRFIRVNPSDLNAINFNQYIDYICARENVRLNYVHQYDYDHFSRIVNNTSFLFLSESFHAAYYTETRLARKIVKIITKSQPQEIYLCYRNDDPRILHFVEFLKKEFFLLFYHATKK
ncbi:LysR family transcriptional regulator [Dehalobacter sp. DCM]|uniref:LysR family transcriptional regulator n=1 Tax=Dehalobacter sp. DCM TaxID=2907827 RepID=UPI0030812281|nr:LysR family transcriptional regulator [Dehalobacter sp. DCM]